jgi:hypothetical protein
MAFLNRNPIKLGTLAKGQRIKEFDKFLRVPSKKDFSHTFVRVFYTALSVYKLELIPNFPIRRVLRTQSVLSLLMIVRIMEDGPCSRLRNQLTSRLHGLGLTLL